MNGREHKWEVITVRPDYVRGRQENYIVLGSIHKDIVGGKAETVPDILVRALRRKVLEKPTISTKECGSHSLKWVTIVRLDHYHQTTTYYEGRLVEINGEGSSDYDWWSWDLGGEKEEKWMIPHLRVQNCSIRKAHGYGQVKLYEYMEIALSDSASSTTFLLNEDGSIHSDTGFADLPIWSEAELVDLMEGIEPLYNVDSEFAILTRTERDD